MRAKGLRLGQRVGFDGFGQLHALPLLPQRQPESMREKRSDDLGFWPFSARSRDQADDQLARNFGRRGAMASPQSVALDRDCIASGLAGEPGICHFPPKPRSCPRLRFRGLP
jgi:hypothetical protein